MGGPQWGPRMDGREIGKERGDEGAGCVPAAYTKYGTAAVRRATRPHSVDAKCSTVIRYFPR